MKICRYCKLASKQNKREMKKVIAVKRGELIANTYNMSFVNFSAVCSTRVYVMNFYMLSITNYPIRWRSNCQQEMIYLVEVAVHLTKFIGMTLAENSVVAIDAIMECFRNLLTLWKHRLLGAVYKIEE